MILDHLPWHAWYRGYRITRITRLMSPRGLRKIAEFNCYLQRPSHDTSRRPFRFVTASSWMGDLVSCTIVTAVTVQYQAAKVVDDLRFTVQT